MGISVQSTIKLNIDGQEIILTHDQALSLWAGLCKALGKPQQAITYPPGVRHPMINDKLPSSPQPWPWQTPPVLYDTTPPQPYANSHTFWEAPPTWNEKEDCFETKDGIVVSTTQESPCK